MDEVKIYIFLKPHYEIVGLSINNMLLWTTYGSYDPEVSNFGTQPISGNIEVTPYPSSRRLFFTIKADL